MRATRTLIIALLCSWSVVDSFGQSACPQPEAQLAAKFHDLNATPVVRRTAGLTLTQCQLGRRDTAAALQILTRLLVDFPNDPDVLYQSAKIHMRAWNDSIQGLYRNAPASFRVNQLSAEVFETQSRFPEAIAEYRKAIAKNPAALNLHFRLGRAILLASHDPAALEQAQQQFEAELALNPTDAAAEYEVGTILLARQRSAEAGPHFEKAAALAPDFPEALIALGKLRAEAKRMPEAIELLERAVKLAPQMESARYALMLAYRNSGRADDARRQAAEIEKLRKPPEGEFTEFLKKLEKQP